MNTNLQIIYNVLGNIAKATRRKLQEPDSVKYKLEEIPEKILSIESGGVQFEVVDEYKVIPFPKDIFSQDYVFEGTLSVAQGYSVITVTKDSKNV